MFHTSCPCLSDIGHEFFLYGKLYTPARVTFSALSTRTSRIWSRYQSNNRIVFSQIRNKTLILWFKQNLRPSKGRHRHLPEKQRRRWASRQPRDDTSTGQRTRKSNSEETSTVFYAPSKHVYNLTSTDAPSFRNGKDDMRVFCLVFAE